MKKKRIISSVCAVIFVTVICLGVLSVSANNGTISLTGIPAGTLRVGDIFVVNVNLGTNPGIAAMGIQVDFSSSTISLETVTNLASTQNVGFSGFDHFIDSGLVRLNWDHSANATGTGNLAALTFRVAAVGSATINMGLSAGGAFNAEGSAITIPAISQITISNLYCTACTSWVGGGEGWVGGSPATCSAPGDDVTRECATCGFTENQAGGAALGPQWGAWDETQAATCNAPGSRRRECEFPGCTNAAHRFAANTEAIAQLAVIWGPWENVTAATCTENGLQAQECTRAGCNNPTHGRTRPIPATGHSWGAWTVTTPVTNDADGEQTRTCSNCQATETESISRVAGMPGGNPPYRAPGAPVTPLPPGAPTVTNNIQSGKSPLIVDIPVSVIDSVGPALIIQIKATEAGNQTINAGVGSAGQNAILVSSDGSKLVFLTNRIVGEDGNVTVNIPAPGDYLLVIRKTFDINGNGSVDASDALEVLKAVAGEIELNEVQQFLANFNSGALKATDALNILKAVVHG